MSLRLLYAEDDALDAELTLAHFRRTAPDLEIDVLQTGEPCERRLAEGGIDLLLLDNHLPDIDGIEVLTRIRGAGHRLPIVMLTGAGDEESVARALLAGADDYVTKAGDYLTKLPSLLRDLATRVRNRQSLEGEAGRRIRQILYVEPYPDDETFTLRHFGENAKHLQLEIVNRCDTALTRIAEGPGFDLIMSDLRVPDMNAMDFLHELRRRGVDLPFIVITGHGDEQTAVALLRLGASDYIVKRDNYLTQLPHSIDHALHAFQLDRTTKRLHADLESLNRSLEQRVAARTVELQREIQERLRAEEDVRASSERYFRALENMLEGCQMLNADWKFVYINEAAARHGRKRRAELMGRRITEVFPGFEDTPIFEGMRRCMTQRIPVQLNSRFVYEDGQEAWFELSIQPVPEGIFTLSIDITERKKAEEALRDSKDDLAVTLQSIGDGVIATDADGRITRMNPTAERLTAWTLKEASGRGLEEVFKVVATDTRLPVVDPVRKVLTQGRVVGLANHTTLLARNGRECQIANAGSPIRGVDGTVRGVVLVFKDVTDEYRVQQLLQKREALLRIAGRTARLGGWAIDLPSMAITWTDEVCGLFDVPAGHVPELASVLDFFAPAWRETARATALACAFDGIAFDMEVEIVTAKERRRWVRATGEAERDERGSIVRVHGAVQDIDEQKQAQRRISEQLAELLRWQTVMVNREGRAQELKAEVNELRARLGLSPAYGTGDGS